jgi:hypothetical protein
MTVSLRSFGCAPAAAQAAVLLPAEAVGDRLRRRLLYLNGLLRLRRLY